MYTEKSATGLYQPHLWIGATEPGFAAMDDAAFRAMADARAAQKFTHVRGVVLTDAAYAFRARRTSSTSESSTLGSAT